ncbi:hypothetical protein SPFM20_00095 [Salmonella phage SPFM20]|nr:hypothetical protein SPFM20_00095 [Salmonella phage SPFM20]
MLLINLLLKPIHFFESQTCHLVESLTYHFKAGLKQDVIVYNLGGVPIEPIFTLSSSESELATESFLSEVEVPTVLRLQDVSGSSDDGETTKVRTPLLEVTLPPDIRISKTGICCGVSELDPNLFANYLARTKQIKGIFERKTTSLSTLLSFESDLPDNPDQLLVFLYSDKVEIRNDIWQEHIRNDPEWEGDGFRNHRGIYIA